MKIALVQMDVAHGQPVENKKYVKEMLERALDDNPDVIVLPEMWNTGFLRLIKFFKPNLKPLICLLSILASSIFVIEYCASKTFFVLFVFKKSP